jgi:hypothetical protein
MPEDLYVGPKHKTLSQTVLLLLFVYSFPREGVIRAIA